jgi:hypothetical protein
MKSFCAVIASFLLLTVNAGTLTWTGAGSTGVWDDYRNWDQKRIPTSSDYVIIDTSNASVTLDIPFSVNTLHISAGTFIQPQPFSVGNLIVDGSGVFNLNSGTASLSADSANITSQSGFIFSSGYFTGSMLVSSQSTLDLSGAASKGFNDAKVIVQGSTICDAGATLNFNGSTVNFVGGLEIKGGNLVNFQTNNPNDDSTITGSLTIDPKGQVQFLVPTQFNSISMGMAAQLTVTKGQQQVTGLTMDSNSVVVIAGSNTGLTAGSISSKGSISTLNAMAVGGRSQILNLIVDGAAPVAFNGPVAFGSLTVKSGSISLSGANTADSAQFGTASISGPGSSLSVGTLKLAGPNTNLANTSITVSGASTFNGQVQIGSGSITVQSGATVQASQFSLLASNGVPVSGNTFINNGNIAVNSVFTITQLTAAGTGSYTVKGKLALQNADLTAGTVALASSTSSFTGSVSSFNAKSISSTASPLNFIDFTVDALTFHCHSPCPAVSSSGRTSTFQASPNSS